MAKISWTWRWALLAGPGATAALALGGCNLFHQPTVEEQADKIATIKVLHQYYPQQYQEVIAMLKAAPSGPAGDERARASIQDRVRPVILGLVTRQAAKTSDDNTLARYQLTLEEAQTVRQKSPEQCGKMLTGEGQLGVTVESTLTKDQIERDAALSARILEQTATTPAAPSPPMDRAVLTAMARQVIDGLPQATKDNLIPMLQAGAHPSSPMQEAATCDYTIAPSAADPGPAEGQGRADVAQHRGHGLIQFGVPRASSPAPRRPGRRGAERQSGGRHRGTAASCQ